MGSLGILLVVFNLNNYKTGEHICSYTNGVEQIKQIRDEKIGCIEEVSSDVKYKKVIYYRTSGTCGFCGNYIDLHGDSVEGAVQSQRNKTEE